MANTVKIKVHIDDDGTLSIVGKKAKGAATSMDALATRSTAADRAIKGTAGISSNATKNFAKMSQGITGGLVPAYATLAANIFAISAAFRFLQQQADLANLEKSQQSFAQSSGVAIKSVTNALQEASGGMLTFRQSSEAAAIGLAKGFSPDQLNELAIGARKVSAALGRDFEDSFSRLLRGVSKAEPELLDELGITLRLENATKRYADALGKNAKELTEFERSQAVLVETQRQLNQQFGQQELQVNPFKQLQVTFDTLIKDISQSVLPLFEGFATIITRSAGAAIAVFGLIAASIIKSMNPMDSFNKKLTEFQSKHSQAYDKAKTDLAQYKQKLQETTASAEKARQKGLTKATTEASGFVDRGSSSRIFAKMQAGDSLTGVDKANLNKALKSAEKQYLEHGKIVTGIFKGEDIKRVRSFGNALKQSETKTISTTQRIATLWKKMTLSINVGTSFVKKGWASAMGAMGIAAVKTGALMSKALSLAGWIGIIKIVYEGLVELGRNAYDVTVSILGFLDKVINSGVVKTIKTGVAAVADALAFLQNAYARGFVFIINGIIEGVQKLLEVANKVVDLSGPLEALENTQNSLAEGAENAGSTLRGFAEGLRASAEETSNLAGQFESGQLLPGLREFTQGLQESGRAAEEAEARLQRFKETLDALREDYKNARDGFGLDLVGPVTAIEDANIGRKTASALQSLPIVRMLEQAKDAGTLPAALQALQEFDLPQIQNAIRESGGDFNTLIDKLKELQDTGRRAVSFDASFTDSLETLQEALRNPDDLINLALALENSERNARAATQEMGKLSLGSDTLAKLNEEAGGSFITLKNKVDGLLQSQQKLKLEEIDRNERSENAFRSGAVIAGQIQNRINLESALADVENKRLEIGQLLLAIEDSTLTPQQEETKKRQLAIAQAELAVLQRRSVQVEKDISDIGQLSQTFTDNFQNGLVSAFDSIIQGTASAKDAFKNMAIGVLQALSQVIAKLIAVKLIESSLAIFAGGGGGGGALPGGNASASSWASFYGAKNGGVFSDGKKMAGYSVGGIAQGSANGYPAMLHGTEAVVPLPNGKSIPVQMNGAGQNNVTVNVSIDNQGNASTNTQQDSAQAGNLGQAIARAVQMELQNQKRSGGILSPYGAA